MRFSEEFELYINVPREQVWEAFQDFASWPSWSPNLKEVARTDRGWRFKARGQPPVDLVWVAEAVRREPPEFLEFRSVSGEQHNLDVSGWVRLVEDGDKTHLEMHFEARPDYSSALVERLAEAYATYFGEPSKLLKITMEHFKEHLERNHPRATEHIPDPI
jgi:uncharacterized membrane protein